MRPGTRTLIEALAVASLILCAPHLNAQEHSEIALPPNGNNQKAEVSQWIGLVAGLGEQGDLRAVPRRCPRTPGILDLRHPDDKFWPYVGLARAYTALDDKTNAIASWETALRNAPPAQAAFRTQLERTLQTLKNS
jgi:hypothetical protein